MGLSELTPISSAQKDSIVREVFKSVDQSDVETAASNAKTSTDELYNRTERTLYREFKNKNQPYSSILWAEFNTIDKYAKELSYPALISISATQQLRRLIPFISQVLNYFFILEAALLMNRQY